MTIPTHARKPMPPSPRMRAGRRLPAGAPLALALLAGLAAPAQAIDVNYEVGVSLAHTDNIDRSETDEVDETVLAPLLRFDAEQTGARVELLARGEFAYLHYLDNTFDDDLRSRFAGQLNWDIVPERIDLIAQNYLSFQAIDDLAAFTPGNEQQINVFIVGPSFHARFSPATRGQLDLRYTNTYAEESKAFDSDRLTAAARVTHDLGTNSRISANFEATDASFDRTDLATDFKRYDGYVGYILNRTNSDLGLELGYSRAEFDAGQPDTSEPLVRANLDWRITPRSELRTTFRNQLTDAAQNLVTRSIEDEDGELDELSPEDVLVSPSLFRERLARVRYVFTTERLGVRVAPYVRDLDYVDAFGRDRESRGVNFGINYQIRPRLSLIFRATAERREFDLEGISDRNRAYRVGLVNQFTRHWSGRIDLGHRERDSNAIGRSYDVNTIALSVLYRR